MTSGEDMDVERALRERLEALQTELSRTWGELAALPAASRLPGLYLMAEAEQWRVLIPSSSVVELVRRVAHVPVPRLPEWIPGTILYRGAPAWVLDLAKLFGARREPSVDAHLVVLLGPVSVALLVDRVVGLVEDPELVRSGANESADTEAISLSAALCRIDGAAVPLLAVDRLVERVRAEVA